ncbi:MAG TPA: N-acetyl-gamma-glutamyl-phosphate reductase [Thermomicrobiales bacterium]|nr:N-acetyl-gamma-glutamyl-phosphate reductase [Chloroflexota bacterium]HQZ90866.1 N-acetyl-gamma-glutamyl-phosphate reductase [Thermomicrobiales bacterium]HRA32217.1 N-acetyl-gamma-glutamyl-phosphate reductase [Thermomicrobiales bacterium]
MAGLKASIVGGSGYAGGELLRLLLGHPEVEVAQVTSRSLAGKLVTTSHPNLRKRTTLKYSMPAALESCDVLFICVPHGASSPNVSEYLDKAGVIIDLSADFRLRDATDYKTWYGWEHPRPELIPTTVYGLPELHREEIRQANYIASPGCNATASILALYPLAASGLLDPTMPIVVEAKSGSSGSGVESGPASHHPERSGVMRSFKPTGHRHSAEVIQELSVNGFCPKVSFTATSVEAVRGILATAHAFTKEPVTDKDLWKIYRGVYGSEPFVRIVKETHGIHRTPEPKILSGTNFCDVGFDVDPHGNRVVVTAAIDNLMKGAAGQALQAMNIRMGFEETLGLEFMGLHPV